MYEDEYFGIVEFRLKELMDEKNISINQMSRLTDVHYDTIKKYYYGEFYSITLEILGKFCKILNCEISDLLKYSSSETFVR